MAEFKALFRREWQAQRSVVFVTAGLVVAWIAGWAWFGAFRSQMPAEAVTFALVPLIGGYVVAFFYGLAVVDEEWKRGTVSHWLMVPVRGTVLLAVKLAVFVLAAAVVIGMIIVGAYVVWLAGGRPFLEISPLAVPVGIVWSLVIITVIYMLTVMATIAARCVSRTWGRAVGIIAFIASGVVMAQIGALVNALGMRLWPAMEAIDLCVVLRRTGGNVEWASCPIPSPVMPSSIVLNALFVVGLFALAAYLLERRAEV